MNLQKRDHIKLEHCSPLKIRVDFLFYMQLDGYRFNCNRNQDGYPTL